SGAQRVDVSFEISKNPSLTLRVSFCFSTLLVWLTGVTREERHIKTDASGFLWFREVSTTGTLVSVRLAK
ncbi:MAG: hypothetical protein KDA83_22540, partial [Planctomycetales bacterium]|nr:hypothetical protein [Planctomycetales bacterium]